jgi:hypothetical protein
VPSRSSDAASRDATRLVLLAALAAFGALGCSDHGVTPPDAPDTAVARIVVTPASASLSVGGSVTLTAQARNGADSVLASVVPTWSASPQPHVALSATSGAQTVATGTSEGVDTVTVSVGDVHARVVLAVQGGVAPGGAPVLLAVGDIAWCGGTNDEQVASVVDGLLAGGASALAVLGDIAYENGTADNFQSCYDPAWGKFKSVTRPTPGNHEYMTAAAAPYYQYFGARAGDAGKGYYSYDLGSWHVVVLNANTDFVPVAASSAQGQWLAADLAAHPNACTLAYWHQPRFSSGLEHGNDPKVQPLWDALYAAGADLVLNGHDHDYERFAPQDPSGARDDARGITEFVVGTGGRSLYPVGTRKPNSIVFDNSTYGVLRLTLREGGYDYAFVPAAGGHAIESGSGTCH